jgi:aldose 1-epimerase
MRTTAAAVVLSALFCTTSTLARPQVQGETLTGTAGNTTIAGSSAGPDANGKYVIEGINIRANFITYGASISNLFINDTSGIERDIVGGFDNASYYGIVSTCISPSEKGCWLEKRGGGGQRVMGREC